MVSAALDLPVAALLARHSTPYGQQTLTTSLVDVLGIRIALERGDDVHTNAIARARPALAGMLVTVLGSERRRPGGG